MGVDGRGEQYGGWSQCAQPEHDRGWEHRGREGAGTSNTNGHDNAFFGTRAGFANTTAGYNSFFGADAGWANTTGGLNSFFGALAGYANAEGWRNSFFGHAAGFANTTGDRNSFFGQEAGRYNSSGKENAFFGQWSGFSNTTGDTNAFFGASAGYSNITGADNAFFGGYAGYKNTSGYSNSFFGRAAGSANTTGSQNAFFGRFAGMANTWGSFNAFFGSGAGSSNTTGSENAFAGREAGKKNSTGGGNAFFGAYAGRHNITGGSNAFFGTKAGYSNSVEDENTLIGTGADLDPGDHPVLAPVTNATALGFRAYVSRANSLVLGSIAGLNGAEANVNVGIGTPAPSAALHVARADGTALVEVEEASRTTASRVLFRLTNNGGPAFRLLNSSTGREWSFAMDSEDNFILSGIGTGGELKISRTGEVIMGPGGSEVFDLQPTGDLVLAGGLTAGGFYYASDRNRKTDIRPIDGTEVLQTVVQLPVATWRFKTDDERIRHAGPMAQDFYSAFGLGSDNKTISASDISGVALAAIQGLYRELASKDAAIAQLLAARDAQQDEIEELKQAVGELRATIEGRASGRGECPPGNWSAFWTSQVSGPSTRTPAFR